MEQEVERQLIREMAGSMNFILSFYDPSQRHLDTEAWKRACASAVRSFNAANEFLGGPWIDWAAQDGETRKIIA